MSDSCEQPETPVIDVSACRSAILFLARELCNGASRDVEAFATAQGWIDPQGAVTPEGVNLVEALQGQAQTRSVFRPFS